MGDRNHPLWDQCDLTRQNRQTELEVLLAGGKIMNFKHMDFQKNTIWHWLFSLIVILVYAVVFAAPVRRKSEEFQEELVRTERQIREQKDLSENKRWIEQEMDGLPFVWRSYRNTITRNKR